MPERKAITFCGTGTERVKVGALYAKRDDPFDIRFWCDLPAPDEYDRLGEVDASLGGMLVACVGGYRLMVGGEEYDALAVAMGDTPARLSATNGAEAHALALVPDILAAQPHCPRHRAPCARCIPETPRARWLAERGVRACACEDDPCGCGVSAFLAAASVSTIAMTRGALAILKAIDAVHGKANANAKADAQALSRARPRRAP